MLIQKNVSVCCQQSEKVKTAELSKVCILACMSTHPTHLGSSSSVKRINMVPHGLIFFKCLHCCSSTFKWMSPSIKCFQGTTTFFSLTGILVGIVSKKIMNLLRTRSTIHTLKQPCAQSCIFNQLC